VQEYFAVKTFLFIVRCLTISESSLSINSRATHHHLNMKTVKSPGLFVFFVFISTTILFLSHNEIHAQLATSVYDINRNPGAFVRENVVVEGLIVQYVPGTSATLAHYLLRDDMGETIQVNTTTAPPVTNEKYRVTGVVYHENRRLFISELTRESLTPPPPAPPPSSEPPQVIIAEQDNTLLYIMFLSVILLSLVVTFLFSRKKQTPLPPVASRSASTGSEQQPPRRETPVLNDDAYKTFLTASEENTIVIDKEYMTMKALPGKLVILNGSQSDKTLNLFGASTPEGQAVTIGRESPDWKKHMKPGREHAHIRIQDGTKTLSRLQAEIVFGNGEIKLRNMGQANPTIVDGETLSVGGTASLKQGSIIQAGNLKMRFEL
jgi:hypothetical protein